jgi:hypothetical protein
MECRDVACNVSIIFIGNIFQNSITGKDMRAGLLFSYRLIIFCLFCFVTTTGSAKDINPDYNEVFLQGEVTIIEMQMDENDKQILLHPKNLYDDVYYPVDFRYWNSKLDTTVYNIGIRLRGNTARRSEKRPFKIDFKEFGGDQFLKLKKLNLKPNTNDPSQLREYLTILMYRKMGVPIARANYTEVYINDEYMGVYLNVENIDDEFVDRRFGNEDGNLYKCAYGASLLLSNDVYDNGLFELKTNEDTNDRLNLEDFIKLINDKSISNWSEKINAVFDVDNYLKQLAVEAMTGHWDGYSYNINNYYLYENPETGKIIYIPYDMDNTWGIDWVGKDWGKRDLLDWSSDANNTPLTNRLLDVEEYRDKYIRYLYEVLDFFKDIQYFDSIASSHYSLLSASIDNDLYYLMAFNFKHSDFYNSWEEAAGGHVKYGIADYIETRSKYAEMQLPEITGYDVLESKSFHIYPNPCNGETVNISSFNGDIEKLSIFNSLGAKIEFSLQENKIIFKNKMSKGIYIIVYGDVSEKFIVE